MSPKVFDKICLICGDKASGFHFDAISCESCKSFFRRNATKFQGLRCFLGGQCKIDLYNRTYCKKCRLKKCFDCGMKTEYILSEEQKKLRKTIIEENRKRKSKLNNSSGDEIEVCSQSSIDFNYERKLSNDITTNLIIYEEESNDVNENKEMSVITIQRPISDPKHVFNELEGNWLTELFNAMQYMIDPLVPFTHPVNDFWEAIHTLYIKLDIDTRKLVKTSKNLRGFTTIDQNDQVVLLKFASIEISLIRMLLQFDFQLEHWNIPTSNQNSNLIKLYLLNNNTRPRNTYPDHLNFLQSIGPEWDSDPVIVDLLTAILLFNPNLPNLLSKDAVKLQKQVYMHLLKRYLQIKYRCEKESENKFWRLISSLNILHELNDKIRVNFRSSLRDLCNIPLVKEICQ